jgi:lysophospholipase L1-like esterase
MRFSFSYVGRLASSVLVSLVCTAGLAQAQYASEISRWNSQDNLDFPAPDGLVFVGSSSIRRWEQLTRDFADYNVIQRGIGGAQFDDVNAQINSLVLKYNPRGVVIWAGTNDLASGSDGNEVFQDYQNFVNAVKATQPDVDIFYLGIMPTPGRQGNLAQENIANSQIAAMAAGDPKLHYIDLPAAFAPLNPYGGAAFHTKFADSIHLNRDGYDLWTSVIRPQIAAVLAPDKTYTPNPNTLAVGESLLYDFGPEDRANGAIVANPDANGNFWNSWRGAAGGGTINAGEHQANLIDISGAPTGIDLTITAGFQANGFQNGGLQTPQAALLGDLAIRNATGDYFFSTADGLQGGGDDDTGGGFMLDGLNPNFEYEFKLFGSRDSTETRITEYRITGANDQSALLTTSANNIGANGVYDGNDDEVVVISGVRPDQFGQVFIDLTLKSGSFAYLNAMQVTATADVSVPEPSAMVLAGAGALALGWLRFRRRAG